MGKNRGEDAAAIRPDLRANPNPNPTPNPNPNTLQENSEQVIREVMTEQDRAAAADLEPRP